MDQIVVRCRPCHRTSCAAIARCRADKVMDDTSASNTETMMQHDSEIPLSFSPSHEGLWSTGHIASATASVPTTAASSSIESERPTNGIRKTRVALACKRCKRRKQRVSRWLPGMTKVPYSLTMFTSATAFTQCADPARKPAWLARMNDQFDLTTQAGKLCKHRFCGRISLCPHTGF
jgi:hypothetical protein